MKDTNVILYILLTSLIIFDIPRGEKKKELTPSIYLYIIHLKNGADHKPMKTLHHLIVLYR